MPTSTASTPTASTRQKISASKPIYQPAWIPRSNAARLNALGFELADGIQDLNEARQSLAPRFSRYPPRRPPQVPDVPQGDQSDEVKQTISQCLTDIVDELKLKI